MRKSIILSLLLVSQIAFGQNSNNVSTFIYKNDKGSISYTKDTLVVKVVNDEVFFSKNVYRIDSTSIYHNNQLIGKIADKDITVNNKNYIKVDGADNLNWSYQSNGKRILECYYRKDETDIISIGFITLNDSIPDIEVLQAIALKSYSIAIKLPPDHDNLPIYILSGFLAGVVTFLMLLGIQKAF